MQRFEDVDLSGAEFRECDLSGARLVGVVMQDAEIDGLVTNLVVNGVDVTPYVEAELDRRHPVRVLIRSDDVADLQRAHDLLVEQWAGTVVRVRSMPAGTEHEQVDGEWSAVQTLRHLVFVHDSWFRRCVRGIDEAFTPLGLAIAGVPDQEAQGLDLDADPSLDEVVAVRERQLAERGAWLAAVTPAELAEQAPVPDGPGWPPYARGRSVARCLRTVLNEEHEHHGFCTRDLDRLAAR